MTEVAEEAAQAEAVTVGSPDVAASEQVGHAAAQGASSAAAGDAGDTPAEPQAAAAAQTERPVAEAPSETEAGRQAIAEASLGASAEPPGECLSAAEAPAEAADDAFADADFARESDSGGESSDDSSGPPLDAYWSAMLNVTKTSEPLQAPKMLSKEEAAAAAARERNKGRNSAGKGSSADGRPAGKSDWKGKGTRNGKVGMYYMNPMNPMHAMAPMGPVAPMAPMAPMGPMAPMAFFAAGGKGMPGIGGSVVADPHADLGRQRSRSPRRSADSDDLRQFLSASREEAATSEETTEHRAAQDQKINDSIMDFLS